MNMQEIHPSIGFQKFVDKSISILQRVTIIRSNQVKFILIQPQTDAFLDIHNLARNFDFAKYLRKGLTKETIRLLDIGNFHFQNKIILSANVNIMKYV